MDKDTAISKIYQILELSNLSVQELVETIQPQPVEKPKTKKSK